MSPSHIAREVQIWKETNFFRPLPLGSLKLPQQKQNTKEYIWDRSFVEARDSTKVGTSHREVLKKSEKLCFLAPQRHVNMK